MDIKAKFNEHHAIPIGLVGENNYRKVHINVSDIMQEYPNARFELILQREGDEVPYPVTTQLKGSDLIWLVSDVDVAVKGRAKAEVIAFNDDVIAKSKIFVVNVEASLDPAGEVPEPLEEWYRTILNASSIVRSDKVEVLNAKDIVLETAETVETKKNETISAAQFAHEFKTLAESFTHGGTGSREGEDKDNAKYYYELAKEAATEGGMLPQIYDPQHKQTDIFAYIDDAVEPKANKTEVELKSNKPTQVIGTIYADRWVDGVYTFAEYPFSEYDLVIVNPTVEATEEEMEAYENMKPRALLGVNAFKAEEVPTIDIPVLMEVTLK